MANLWQKSPYARVIEGEVDVANSEKLAKFVLCVEQDAKPSRPTHVPAGGPSGLGNMRTYGETLLF